jgi:hypothetical protein
MDGTILSDASGLLDVAEERCLPVKIGDLLLTVTHAQSSAGIIGGDRLRQRGIAHEAAKNDL